MCTRPHFFCLEQKHPCQHACHSDVYGANSSLCLSGNCGMKTHKPHSLYWRMHGSIKPSKLHQTARKLNDRSHRSALQPRFNSFSGDSRCGKFDFYTHFGTQLWLSYFFQASQRHDSEPTHALWFQSPSVHGGSKNPSNRPPPASGGSVDSCKC